MQDCILPPTPFLVPCCRDEKQAAVLAVEATMQQKAFGLFVSPLGPGDWFHMGGSSGRVFYNQLIALPVWLELLLVGGLPLVLVLVLACCRA